ncbi:MAG: hypothetical protein ACI8P9_003131 [Parasphingorhabdus sp.]|jgi:hypothetical protein
MNFGKQEVVPEFGKHRDLLNLVINNRNHCEVLPENNRCSYSSGRAPTTSRRSNILELNCASDDHAYMVQSDIYVYRENAADYVRSCIQSCAFIQYDIPETFDLACELNN